ncbi:MAG: toll/interleukin-1 receptor domain-containing protein [Pseudomonadota bacterium]
MSYSHADSAFASRFHQDLERWRAGRGLRGRDTPTGPVPSNLRPIFRDRDDFAGGGTLGEATNEALEDSDFLILLCSPASARSAYVNEEIRSFKAMGGSERIIPVIVEGEPGHPERNCFPEALIRKIGPDGQLTDEIEDRLAADARSVGDGPRRALAKVIAGLLGVSFDEIVRRAEAAEQRRNRIVAGVASMMTVLAVLAAGFGWLAENRRVVAERNYQAAVSAADSLLGQVGEELIRTEGVSLATTRRLLSRSEAIYDQLIETLPEAREVKVGKIAALSVFSRAYYDKGDIAAAIEAQAEAERLTLDILGDDVATPAAQWSLAMIRAERAKLLVATGDHEGAEAVLAAALQALDDPETRTGINDAQARYVFGVAVQLALLQAVSGDLDGAEGSYVTVRRLIVERQSESANPSEWRTLESTVLATEAAMYEQRGDLAVAAERLDRAINLLRISVAKEPDFAQARTLLAQVLRARGQLAEALDGDRDAARFAAESNYLTESLAEADTEDRAAQVAAAEVAARRLLGQIGDGDDSGLDELRTALRTVESIAAKSPDLASAAAARRDLLSRAAAVFNEARRYAEAASAAQRLIAIEAAAAHAAGDDAASGRLAAALVLATTAADGRGRLEQALAFSERALAIERELAATDPGRQAGLAYAEWRSGSLLWRLSRRAEAELRYTRVVELFEALVASAPDNLRSGSALSQSCVNLGELRAVNGDVDGARAIFAKCIKNAERVLSAAPAERAYQLDLAWALARIALLQADPARWRRVAALLSDADRVEPLDDLNDELLTVARLSAAR